jgi:hypothetical protein
MIKPIIVISVLLLVVIFFAAKEDSRLIDQCLKDGKKEYECRAMLKNNCSSYPVIIYH